MTDPDGRKRRYLVGDLQGAEKEARYEREGNSNRTDVSVESCSEDCLGKRLAS